MSVADLSDDELLLLATGPEDNLAKQRARGPRPAAKAAPSPHADLSDDEILAAIGEVPREKAPEAPFPRVPPPATTSYSGPTDYRAGAGLPPAQPRVDLGPSSDENVAATEAHSGVLEEMLHPERNPHFEPYGPPPVDPENPTPQERERASNPHDFLTDTILTGAPTMLAGRALGAVGRAIAPEAGPLLSRAGRAIQGAGSGAAGAYSGGAETPREIALGAGIGAVGGMFSRGAKAAHEPRTQAEIDAAVIKRGKQIHPDPELEMQGTRENVRLATEADRLLEARQSGLKARSGEMMDQADVDYSMLDSEYPIPDTSRAIDRIQSVREQSHGGQGAMLSSDPVLAEMQRQMTIGKERTAMLPRGELRNVQKNLNEAARFEHAQRGATRAEGALQQGAGIVADTARSADPRLAPGNLGGALDKYGATEDALSNVDKLRGPEAGRVSKIARVGGAGRDAAEGAIISENEVAALQQAEPVANSLIDRIRYNQTAGRRSFRLPYLGYSAAGNVERLGKANLGNLAFKLAPPKIDAQGMVAAQPARNLNAALPLELELMLLSQKQKREGQQ